MALLVAISLIASTPPPIAAGEPLRWPCSFEGTRPAKVLGEGIVITDDLTLEVPAGSTLLAPETADRIELCLERAEEMPARCAVRIQAAREVEQAGCKAALEAASERPLIAWRELSIGVGLGVALTVAAVIAAVQVSR